MPSVDYDLGYLRAGLEVLEDYLMSDEIYWGLGAKPPPGEPSYPQLTLGGLMLAMARLKAHSHTPRVQGEYTQLLTRLQNVHERWRSAWGNKASREFHSRLRLWGDFLEEYRSNPQDQHDRYPYEVRLRVMLELLKPDADQAPQADFDMLQGLDRILQAILVTGDFIWQAELASAFPKEVYWYLYGNLAA